MFLNRSSGHVSLFPTNRALAVKCLVKKGKNSGGAQQCAAHRLHRLTRERPVPTTNRKCRRGVDRATAARFARDGVTGSAPTEATYPSLALGLACTDAGNQMEKVNFPCSPCRSFARLRARHQCKRFQPPSGVTTGEPNGHQR